MVTCNISYDNNHQGIYFSGQTLSGAIEITNEKKRNIKGITLKIEGFAKCKWTETVGGYNHTRVVYYKGKEEYFNNFSYLIGSSNEDPIELAEGVHKFNFISDLPPHCPTSLESKYGDIRYQVKVEVERPWKTDFKFCYPFTVLKPLDLNYENPTLKLPLKVESSKTFFLKLSNKTLYLSAEIPFCGYVSGQSANVSVLINNESSVEVSETTIEVMRKFYYNSDKPSKKTKIRKERVTLATHPGVPCKEKREFREEILISPVPPTNTGTCRTIQVFYEILVTAKTSGMHRNLTAAIPITIGNVPLASTYQIINPVPSEKQHSGSNMEPNTSQASYPLAPEVLITHDLPPPSYQEAMMTPSLDDDKKEDLDEQKTFNPKYPVFDFSSQVSMQPTDEKNEKTKL